MKKLLFTVLMGMSVSSFAMSANDIIDKANQASYYKGNDGSAVVSMDIKDSQGRSRNRKFTILRKNVSGQNQKFYVYFERPSDVKKTAFLVHKNTQKDDDRWMYLPSLDLVKRIASGDKRTSFVGSTFFYEDVSGRNPQEDNFELVDTTDDYYVIKGTPKKADTVEFSSYKTWIHKTTFLPIKMSYLDKSGKEYRTYSADKVETVGGFPTVVQATMSDLGSGGKTTISYSKVKYNVGLPEDVFTERYLKTPPQEWLK
ncbi:MAG: outer membrane lipoprotein-sorting protein [Alphaproteobacteria bacterium]|nr:outer membrane lipoprotein-sorting protein [Alphaproteobacteria bacterium]